MNHTDGLDAFLAYHRKMFGLFIAAAAVVTVVLIILKRDDLAWAGGFAIGSLAQLFKFGFIDVNVVKKIAVEKKDAAGTQLKTMFLSLAVFAAAVLVVHKLKWNVWAMAAGIFLPRLLLLADAYVRPNPFGPFDEQDDAGRRFPEDDGANKPE